MPGESGGEYLDRALFDDVRRERDPIRRARRALELQKAYQQRAIELSRLRRAAIEDAYAGSNYAGSAISAVAAGENVVAGLLPLATKRLYHDLGFQWASSLIGFLALLLSCAPIVFVWKGRWFRERSPFMESGGQTYKAERTSSKS